MNIKYRVWDVGKKVYIQNTGNPNIFPFNGKIGMTCNGNTTGSIYTYDWIQKAYILEQYTGLVDKNGKEIYEGDIVRMQGAVKSLMPLETFSEIAEVVYSGGMFCATNDYGCCEPIGYKPSAWEIVANIHDE